jgi:predicted nucleic acid-binding protein
MYDTHRLFYPDAASRSVFYNGGKQWGYLSTNDIHELENMNPVGDQSGEKYWMPVNMQTMDDPVNLGQEAQFEFNKTHPAPPTAIPHLFPGGPTSTTPPSGMPKSPNPLSAKVTSTSPKPQAGGTGRAMIASYSRGFTRLFDDNIGKIVQRGATKEQDFNRIWSPILHTVVDTIVAANTLMENQAVRGADETMLAYAQRIYVARSTDNTSEKYEKQIKDFIVGLKTRSVDWTAMNKTMVAETEARYALVYFDKMLAAENRGGPGSGRHPEDGDQDKKDSGGKTTLDHAENVLALHNANGGASYSLSQGNMVGTDNYAVSTNPERTVIVEGSKLDDNQVSDYINKNADLLSQPDKVMGTWYNPDDHSTYLDVTTLVSDKDTAIAMGKAANQIAIYSLKDVGVPGKDPEIKTGGTGRNPVDDKLLASLSKANLKTWTLPTSGYGSYSPYNRSARRS